MHTAKTIILAGIVTLFLAIPCFGGDADQKAAPADATDEKPTVAASDTGDGGTVVGEDDDPLSDIIDMEALIKEAEERAARSKEEAARSKEELARSKEELARSKEELETSKKAGEIIMKLGESTQGE